MDNNLLGKVISVEKDIQGNLESEKKKVCEWLEEITRQTEDDFSREEEVLKASHNKALEDAEAGAGKEAARIMEAASARAVMLRGIGDAPLRKIVMMHIRQIIPGKMHDSQNVQD